MDDLTPQSVLQRMVKPARPPENTGCGGVSPALRRAIVRAGDGLGLKLDVPAVQVETALLAGLLGSLTDGAWLLVVLDGPDGRRGAMALDAACVTALIEVQTLGRLSGASPPQRPLTRTDAAMAEPFISALLQGLGGADSATLAAGYSYGAPARDLHGLGILLDDVPHQVVRSSLTFDGSAHGGQMLMALPEGVSADTPAAAEPDRFSQELEHNLGGAQMVLDVVLHRLSLPLDQAQGLAVGQMLDIPGTALSGAVVRAAGKPVLQGRLGQINGMRAIKLQGGDYPWDGAQFSDDPGRAGVAPVLASVAVEE